MARLYENEAICPTCNNRRDMQLTHRITGAEDFLERTVAGMDLPPLAIIRGRNGSHSAYFEMTGDKASFFSFS